MPDRPWAQLAHHQDGMMARRQLLAIGVDRNRIRNQVAAGRWIARSPMVISSFTGSLSWRQRCWLGALHAGGTALIGGLSATAVHGLQRWDRDEISVLVDDQMVLDPVPGIRWVRTRRDMTGWIDPSSPLPLCRLEPAALLFAAYTRSSRTAQGLLAAVVQQRLTDPSSLHSWILRLRPLRRAAQFRRVLEEIAGGAQSIGELDVARMCRRFGLPRPRRQVRRRDALGRVRYTDCEWRLADGRVVVLEVDGGFHMETEHWEDDIARERRLSLPRRTAIRCTTRELREEPESIAADLTRLGVGTPAPGRVAQRAL